MCEERYHATVCVAVRKCFKIYIFIHIIAETSTYVQPANQLVKI